MTDLEKLALLPGEEEAIETVLRLAKTHGYGNLMGYLQRAWQARLQSWGLSEEAARLGSFDCRAWETQGRIEGLEEAAAACAEERDGMERVESGYPDADTFIQAANNCVEIIRDRIKELKGE